MTSLRRRARVYRGPVVVTEGTDVPGIEPPRLGTPHGGAVAGSSIRALHGGHDAGFVNPGPDQVAGSMRA
jgi:hypothetical protein